MMFKRFISIIVLLAFSIPAMAAQMEIPREELDDILRVKIRAIKRLAGHRTVVKAVREQNAKNMSLGEIKRLDQEWRSTKAVTAFKKSLQTNAAGRRLKWFVQRSASYGEAFLTDNKGANVAAFPATSDYWQGDEEKFIASFNSGSGKIFIGPVEYDESSDTHAAQVSVPVMYRGRTVGVLVVGVKLDYIAWKQKRAAVD